MNGEKRTSRPVPRNNAASRRRGSQISPNRWIGTGLVSGHIIFAKVYSHIPRSSKLSSFGRIQRTFYVKLLCSYNFLKLYVLFHNFLKLYVLFRNFINLWQCATSSCPMQKISRPIENMNFRFSDISPYFSFSRFHKSNSAVALYFWAKTKHFCLK